MSFTFTRRRVLRAALMACGAASVGLAAHAQQAQAWPDKPVRIIAAGPAGATADMVARLLGDALAKEGGQPVIVDPRPGAGGALAVNELSNAPHDGYTLLVGVNSLVSEIPHIVKLKFDMAREIAPVAELGRGGLVLVGNPNVPAKDFAQLRNWIKSQPGAVSYASYSPGTLSHVMGLQLNKAAGLDMTHVGYKGSTPALTDVMGGHVPLMFDGIPSSLPLIRAGKIRAFAISAAQRSPLLPDVPTFTELGYPQVQAPGWMGVWVKADGPGGQQGRLRETVLRLLGQPALRAKLQELGFEPGQPRSQEELNRSLQADYRRMGEVLKSIDFKPE